MRLTLVRYVLPGRLVLARVAMLIIVHGSLRCDGFAMLVGSGLSVAFLNLLFRLGVAGDHKPDEQHAREFCLFCLIGFENRLRVLTRWAFSFLSHFRGARPIKNSAAQPVPVETPRTAG
jgi:hypothetical protein